MNHTDDVTQARIKSDLLESLETFDTELTFLTALVNTVSSLPLPLTPEQLDTLDIYQKLVDERIYKMRGLARQLKDKSSDHFLHKAKVRRYEQD